MSSARRKKQSENSVNDNKDYESMLAEDLRTLLTMRGVDCSYYMEKSELIALARRSDTTNYDDEAHKLFRELLHLDPAALSTNNYRYSTLNAIWRHETGGGTVYVGNYMAASTRQTLNEHGIVAVMNCQEEGSTNYFEGDPNLHYYRFVVSRLAMDRARSSSPMDGGFQQAFDFIQQHIERGESVLVHCLAGAHRAGTVGTAWLMYNTGMGVYDAIALAKKCRPVIDPFGRLKELLFYLQFELENKKTYAKAGKK